MPLWMTISFGVPAAAEHVRRQCIQPFPQLKCGVDRRRSADEGAALRMRLPAVGHAAGIICIHLYPFVRNAERLGNHHGVRGDGALADFDDAGAVVDAAVAVQNDGGTGPVVLEAGGSAAMPAAADADATLFFARLARRLALAFCRPFGPLGHLLQKLLDADRMVEHLAGARARSRNERIVQSKLQRIHTEFFRQ